MTILSDQQARQEALNIAHSFCVQAPAGSGKTELLTQRILKLLAHCQQPEEILAFTFTRKAAAEMRKRLLDSLQRAASLSDTERKNLQPHAQLTDSLARAVLKRNEALNWQLLENTRRLRITTIDSFNAWLTSQLPLISSFGSQPEVTEDIEPVYAIAIRETLDYLNQEHPAADALATLMLHLNNNFAVTEGLLVSLLYRRDQWLPYILEMRQDPDKARSVLEANLQIVVSESLRKATTALLEFQSEIMPLIAFAAEQLALRDKTDLQALGLSKHFLPGSSHEDLALWQAIARFFMVGTNEHFRKTVTVANGFPAEKEAADKEEKVYFKEQKARFKTLTESFAQHPDLLTLFQEIMTLPAARYQENQWQALSALTTLLPFLAAQLNVALKLTGTVDYTQVSLAALEALGPDDKPTDLALRLDYRIQHLLVDEFQDTSSLQFHLLEKLTRGWETDDGRTLFIVGDGMQSCYGFRDANVGLFLNARDKGIGTVTLKPLQLSINFRSKSQVVAWVNEVFSSAFPEHDDIARSAVAYSASSAITTPDTDITDSVDADDGQEGPTSAVRPDYGVEACLLLAPASTEQIISRDQKRQAEANEVLKICQTLTKQAPAESIAILVRNRSHLDAIVPALREAGINWQASGIDPLLSYPQINDLFTLLKALVNLADKTAWLALLRTPWIGLRLEDIKAIVISANNSDLPVWHVLEQYYDQRFGDKASDSVQLELGEDSQLRLKRVIPVLSNGRKLYQHMPLREWLENTWVALGGPATLGNHFDLSNLQQFFSVIEQADEGGSITDMARVYDKLGRVYGNQSGGSTEQLSIMTIHNAKGLEFDHVIIPGLDRMPRSDDNPLLLWREYLDAQGNGRLLIGMLRARGEQEDPLYQYLKYEQKLRTHYESTRLLYIAVTRAIRKAYLLANVDEKNAQLSTSSSALLASILPQLERSPETLQVRLQTLSAAPESPPAVELMPTAIPMRRLPSNWQNESAAMVDETQHEMQTRTLAEPVHQNLLAKKTGILVHSTLQFLVEHSQQLSPAEIYQQYEPALLRHWAIALSSLCQSPKQVQQAVHAVKQNIDSCLHFDKAGWLLSNRHAESACELSMSDYSKGYRQEFIIDRTFVDDDGTRWIIDYKSSLPAPAQTLADFINEQSASYTPQLEKYAWLMQQTESRPIKTALFFTAVPCLHVLPRNND